MRRLLSRVMFSGASFAIAAGALAVATGFAIAAIYLALSASFTAPVAAVLTAACGLAVAVIAAIIGRALLRLPRAGGRGAPRGSDERRLVADLGALMGEEIATLARTHARGTLIASLVAGFAVGASPRLRRLLRTLLKN